MSGSIPHPLVDAQGQVAYGRFPHTLAPINGRAARYLTPMGKPASAFARHFHYKQFQYFGILSDQLLLGCAFADTAWLGLVFLYLYEVESGRLHEWTWHDPLARTLHLSESPRQGASHFAKGANSLRMEYADTSQGLSKRLLIRTPELNLDATLTETGFSPMSLCTRTGINGFTYANKVAGVAVTGELDFNGRHVSLADINACGHHDFSAGYMRRETFWNWACSSASIGHHRLGFNLSCGVNETSFSENCLWLDGRLSLLGGIRFNYQRDDLLKPWFIEDTAGKVELSFTPTGQHQERLNAGLFASNFHQLFGTFSGHLETDAGRLDIPPIQGFVEEQYAKW